MARTHGRARRGERLRVAIPHEHWKTTTFVAGLRNSGMVAPMVLDGPINGELFQDYVVQILVPELRSGDVVVMDKPREPQGRRRACRHRGARGIAARALLDGRRTKVRFLYFTIAFG